MDWKIPLSDGKELTVSTESGDCLFIVGRNGSGKSALIQHLCSTAGGQKVKRISAHRQTWFESGYINLTPQRRKELKPNFVQQEARNEARWMDFSARDKLSSVIFDLVSLENHRARKIADFVDNEHVDDAKRFSADSRSPFGQLNDLLSLAELKISLENSEGEEVLARHEDFSAKFSIAQMSDGERNAAIIAAQVLTLEQGATLLIDEPERHLHRAIIEPFLSALLERRKDCTFIVSTHETALPVAHPTARVLIVRSCQWSGDYPASWDIDLLEGGTDLPEDVKGAILGGRRRVLFVEGQSTSLDVSLYEVLFPDVSVIPAGNCDDVRRVVDGLRRSTEHHRVEAFGLIDRDDRSKQDIAALAENGIFTLNVCSVESLYYCSDAIAAVARRQAESFECDPDDLADSAKKEALYALSQPQIAEQMAARVRERETRILLTEKLPNWKQIVENEQVNLPTLSTNSLYSNELACFKKHLEEESFESLVARYPLRYSAAFPAIAKVLKVRDKADYQKAVISQARKYSTFAERLKERVGSICERLKDNST